MTSTPHHLYNARYYREHRLAEIGRVRARQAATRQFLRELRCRPCADCGAVLPPHAMDFDHRERDQKSFALAAGNALLKSRMELLAEIATARRMWSADHTMVDETYAWFELHGMPADVDQGMREAWLAMGRGVDELNHVAEADDGETIDLGGRREKLKWTPGHTDYHAVLVDEAERVLFAGDHVLPRITSNVGLYPFSRDDPLGDFLDALRSVRTLPVTRVLPAHGEPFDDLPGRVDQVLAHHDGRLAATLDAIGDGERDAYTICRKLFPVLRSPHEERFALAETLAHLRYLERRGKVQEIGGAPVRWSAA